MYILYTFRCTKVQVLRTFKCGTITLFLITTCAIAWLRVRYNNRMLFVTDKGHVEENIQVNATRNTSNNNKSGMHACVLDEPYIVSVHAFEFPRTLLHVH